MMQASKMSLARQGASWLWWAWTAVPCSPDQAERDKDAGAKLQGWQTVPAAGKGGTKINRRPDDRQNFHSLSPPARPARESFESVLVPVSEFSLKRVPAVHDTTIRLLNTASSSHYQAQSKAHIRGVTKREDRQLRGFYRSDQRRAQVVLQDGEHRPDLTCRMIAGSYHELCTHP